MLIPYNEEKNGHGSLESSVHIDYARQLTGGGGQVDWANT